MASRPFDIVAVPLVEASIEVRFPGDARVEARRGEFQRAVRADCPKLFVPKLQQGLAPALSPHVYRNDGGTRTIALAINLLAYSSQDYPGWKAFVERYLGYWSMLEAWVEPERLTRVGLRYVNRFDAALREHLRDPEIPAFLRPLGDGVVRHLGATTRVVGDHELDIKVNFDATGDAELTIDFDAHAEDIEPEKLEATLKTLHASVERSLASTLDEDHAKILGLMAMEDE